MLLRVSRARLALHEAVSEVRGESSSSRCELLSLSLPRRAPCAKHTSTALCSTLLAHSRPPVFAALACAPSSPTPPRPPHRLSARHPPAPAQHPRDGLQRTWRYKRSPGLPGAPSLPSRLPCHELASGAALWDPAGGRARALAGQSRLWHRPGWNRGRLSRALIRSGRC